MHSLSLRKVTLQDAEEANVWRTAHNSTWVDPIALPQTGGVVEDADGKSLGMVWLYITNSKMFYLAWAVTRPGIAPRLAHQALKHGCEGMITLARQLGAHYVISTSSSRGLSKLLVECGLEKQPLSHDLLVMEVS